jgi:hypothetical protein
VRNRYRAALRTYLRWPLVLIAIVAVILALIASLLLAFERPDRITFAATFPFAFWLACLGVAGAEHLREMLGSPRSRVLPGLYETHLVVAGAMTAIVGFVVPCLMAGLTVGLGECGLALVAVTLAALTVPPMLMQRPFAGALVWIVWLPIWLVELVFPQSEFLAETPVSLLSSLALLAASLVSALALAIHFLEFREETPGSSRRGLLQPLWGPESTISDSRDEERWQWSRLRVPVPHNLRGLGGKSPGAGENLLRRARHWHAASQIGPNMLLQGVLAVVMVLAMAIFLGTRSLGHMASLLCFLAPLIGLAPAFVLGLQPAVRARVAGEFLRPFSRTEHVHAVGLVLVVFLAAAALAIIVVPLAAFWLVASKPVRSQQPLWPLAAGLSAIPLFLGVGLANLRESEAFWAILASWIAYPLFLWLADSCAGKNEGWPLFGLCTLMAAIGFAIMRGAYRSWLDRDVG